MEGRTHFALGLLLFALGLGPEAIVGAMLPDIDSKNAVMGSLLISRLFGHRGVFHSLSMLAVLGGTAMISGRDGFALGYASHLALDSLTVGGLRLFAPFSKRVTRGPFYVGSIFDKLFGVVFFTLAIALIF